METKCIVASLRDIWASRVNIYWMNDVDFWVPTLISIGKEQDIVKGRVEWMQVTDVF
jgi:hypothetical protein